jgi:hypothetical protein
VSREYFRYLRSIEWQRIRNRELLRARYKCESCGALWGVVELQVHHLHSETVGSEQEGDLRVLCEPCHRRHHHGGRSDPLTPEWARENLWLARLLRRQGEDDPPKGKDLPF